MSFREVSVIVVREILGWWLEGHGLRHHRPLRPGRSQDRAAYIDAAVAVRLTRSDRPERLTDELVAAVIEAVRPGWRPGAHVSSGRRPRSLAQPEDVAPSA